MNSFEQYVSLIRKAKRMGRSRKDSTPYELHHIRPRCMGGQDRKSNLVLLTAYEHLLAHKLLHEAYPGISGLADAWFLLTFTYSEATLEEIALAREAASEARKGKPKSEEHKRKIGDANRGRKLGPLSEEVKHKISVSKTGKPGPNAGIKLSDETKHKISLGNKNKEVALSTRSKMSKYVYTINGVEYVSRYHVCEELGVSNATVANRCRSDKFPNWVITEKE